MGVEDVRINLGTVAAPDDASYDDDLAVAQRYARPVQQEQRVLATAAGTYSQTYSFPNMRDIPTSAQTTAGTLVNATASLSLYNNYTAILNLVSVAAGDAYVTGRIYLLTSRL